MESREPSNLGLCLTQKRCFNQYEQALGKKAFPKFISHHCTLEVAKASSGKGYTNKITLMHKGAEMCSRVYSGDKFLCYLDAEVEEGLRVSRGMCYNEAMHFQQNENLDSVIPFKISMYEGFCVFENEDIKLANGRLHVYEKAGLASSLPYNEMWESYYMSHVLCVGGIVLPEYKL